MYLSQGAMVTCQLVKSKEVIFLENKVIRKEIEQNLLKYWQVANEVGISESRFSVWLRTHYLMSVKNVLN